MTETAKNGATKVVVSILIFLFGFMLSSGVDSFRSNDSVMAQELKTAREDVSALKAQYMAIESRLDRIEDKIDRLGK